MPETSAFIWYHASAHRQAELLAWLEQLERTLGVKGRLLIRQQAGQTTFMEIFEHIEPELVARIEELAVKTPCFADVQRHCESFSSIAQI